MALVIASCEGSAEQPQRTGDVASSSSRGLISVFVSVIDRANVPTSGRAHATTVSASNSSVLVLEQLLIRSLLHSCLNDVQQDVHSALSTNAPVVGPSVAATASNRGHQGPIHRPGLETRQSSLGVQGVPYGYFVSVAASGAGVMYSVS
jgi:hypothetical protein